MTTTKKKTMRMMKSSMMNMTQMSALSSYDENSSFRDVIFHVCDEISSYDETSLSYHDVSSHDETSSYDEASSYDETSFSYHEISYDGILGGETFSLPCCVTSSYCCSVIFLFHCNDISCILLH